MMRVKTTAHDDGDLSIRLTAEHIDAMVSAFTWMDVRRQAERQASGRFTSSFSNERLAEVLGALQRSGRLATPAERKSERST